MGHPDEKVKSPEKETGSGSTNRLYMYHQRRGNFARNEEENPSDTETSKKEGNHPSEIRGLCLMKLSCEMLQNLSFFPELQENPNIFIHFSFKATLILKSLCKPFHQA